MKIPERKNLTKAVIVASLLSLVAFFVPIHFAYAWLDIGTFAYSAIGQIFFAIGYVIAYIGGVVIALEAWIVGVVLNMNTGVFDATVVQTGFQVSLSIANMGFVLGIIIIAIATILRRETYGIKQLLWKLVVAAILVNFSLVIMAPIFGFANNLTQYFLNSVAPSSGGLQSYDNFATSLAGAFNPQGGFITIDKVGSSGGTAAISSQKGSFSSSGSDIGALLQPIFSVVFVAFSLIVIAIVLAVFALMLVIRYVYIAILAVLAPFAWLLWVFPKTKHLWDQWWDTFIKWTMFAPIVVFFLYLAIITAKNMSSATTGGTQSFKTYMDSSQDGLWGSIQTFFSNGFSSIIANFLNQFVLIALMVGGMIAAEKMSITGASAAVGAVKSVGKAAGGYVAKQSKKGARYTYQHAGGEKLNQALQRSRIPLVSATGRGLAGLTEAGGKNLVTAAAKNLNVAEMSDEKLKMAAQGARGNENTLAILQEAQKRGRLGMLEKVGGEKDLNTWMKKNQEVFKDYDHGKLQGDLNNSLMSNERMRELAEIVADPEQGENAMVRDREGNERAAGELMREESEKFFATKDKADIAKALAGDVFGGKEKFGLSASAINALSQSVAHGMAVETPHLIPSVISKIDSGPKLQNFSETYDRACDGAEAAGRLHGVSAAELKEAKNKSMGNRLVSETTAQTPAAAAPAGGAPPPPPPPPPPHP